MKRAVAFGVGAWMALVASSAFADVLPPDGAPCQGRAPGAACIMMDGTGGTCETATTMRPLADGGSMPVTYVACRAGGDGGTGSDAATSDGGGVTPRGGGCSCRATPARARGDRAALPGVAAAALGWTLLRSRRGRVRA